MPDASTSITGGKVERVDSIVTTFSHHDERHVSLSNCCSGPAFLHQKGPVAFFESVVHLVQGESV
jgi:hypothetical protein